MRISISFQLEFDILLFFFLLSLLFAIFLSILFFCSYYTQTHCVAFFLAFFRFDAKTAVSKDESNVDF